MTLDEQRQTSQIPKTEMTNWIYPSESMFFKALQRKGKEVSESAIPEMLAIHNAMNDAVWQEIVDMERLVQGSEASPKLVKFRGRPFDYSPTAWWHMMIRGGLPPFDRHDWVLSRKDGSTVRYVIDYYAAHQDEGHDHFYVHSRIAIDNWKSLKDRLYLWYHRRCQ